MLPPGFPSHVHCINGKTPLIMLLRIGFKGFTNIAEGSCNKYTLMVRSAFIYRELFLIPIKIESCLCKINRYAFIWPRNTLCISMKRTCASFHHTPTTCYRANCPCKAFHIKKQGLRSALPQVLHIFPIQLCFGRYLKLVPSINLRPSSQSWQNFVRPIFLTLCHQILLVPERRPGAYDAHLPTKNVPDLWQLVQTGSAQHVSYLRNILLRITQLMCRHIMRC